MRRIFMIFFSVLDFQIDSSKCPSHGFQCLKGDHIAFSSRRLHRCGLPLWRWMSCQAAILKMIGKPREDSFLKGGITGTNWNIEHTLYTHFFKTT